MRRDVKPNMVAKNSEIGARGRARLSPSGEGSGREA